MRGVLGTLIAGPLAIKVLDSDAISKDDPLGALELDLAPLGAEGGDDSLEWPDAPLQDVAHGTLSLALTATLALALALPVTVTVTVTVTLTLTLTLALTLTLTRHA